MNHHPTPTHAQWRPLIVLFVLLTALTGVAYPLLVTGIAQGVFAAQANGSLIEREGKPVGSALIGQSFKDPKYFWGRPSATAPDPYNAGASGGSNQGPRNPALVDAVKNSLDATSAATPKTVAAVAGVVATLAAGVRGGKQAAE